MILDLDSEDGKIVLGLASIGAMVVGSDRHRKRAMTEVPASVAQFKMRHDHDRVVDVLKRIVHELLQRN